MNVNESADLSSVSPQRTFLQSHPKLPKAISPLYHSRSHTENVNGGQDHRIVGVHIVLAAGDPNRLWEQFHVDRSAQTLDAATQKKDDKKFLMATRSLTICCDTLEVHGELCVPEADVRIFARRLVQGSADAAINTSPLRWNLAKATPAAGKAPGENGANGRKAGSLEVFVSPDDAAHGVHPRFLARGGVGQDPGVGLDGKPGKDKPSWSSSTWRSQDSWVKKVNSLTVSFSPRAVYVDAAWYGPAHLIPLGKKPLGSPGFPTSGTDAVAPGVPGNGGDGGGLTTNFEHGKDALENGGGAAGATEQNRTGGRAGSPTSSAQYQLYIYLQPFSVTNNPPHDGPTKKPAADNTTTKGADAPAEAAARGDGSAPSPVQIDCVNAWLHPLALQTVLEYARDAYLGGDHDGVRELLASYEQGLALPMPGAVQGWDESPWTGVSLAQWTAAQTEVASMLYRLRGHLDYFGNAAGYTPLLSLQGSIQLYKGETQRALRTLLLTKWVSNQEHKAEEAVGIFTDVIDGMNEGSARAADQVTAARKKIALLDQQLDGFEQDLRDKGTALAALREQLLAEAGNNRQLRHNIMFSIKMAGAITQVIPVGQPALGAVGSLAGVSADLIAGDPEGAPDTVSRMGDVITKSREAARKADEASKKAAAAAANAKKKDDVVPESTETKMGTALDGLGPAVSQVSGAISALQVPAAEVEAELQRLEAECPELQELLQDIHDLNERKAELFVGLAAGFQSLTEGCATLASNAAAVVSLQEQKGEQLGRIDHEASLFVRQMGQRSRLALIKYLYFLVKSYETTMLQTLDDVDWQLDRVTSKIEELLKQATGFDTKSLEEQARTLNVLFEDNLDLVRQKLLGDATRFSEVTMQRTMVLSRTQTPREVAALNESGSVEVDPFAHGLVDPKTQLARLSDADLVDIQFDPEGPELPSGHQIVVDLVPAHTGTLRRGAALCAVYSDGPIRWNWTCSPGGSPTKSPPSKGTEDLLDFVLGGDSDKVRQKITRPPFWSTLSVSVRYLPDPDLGGAEKPRIQSLNFSLLSDVTPVDPALRQCVLMVHPRGQSAGGVVDCSAQDLADRKNGFGHFMRIYGQGSDLQLSATAFGSCLDHWQLIGTGLPPTTDSGVARLKLKGDVIAVGNWVSTCAEVATIEAHDLFTPGELKTLAETGPSDEVRSGARAFLERLEAEGSLKAAPPVVDQTIRVEAREDASIVGLVPAGETADLLREGDGAWSEVNYRGICGWVKRADGGPPGQDGG